MHPQKNKTRCNNAGGPSMCWNRHIPSLNMYLFGMSKSWLNMICTFLYKNQLIATVLTKMSEFLKAIWVFTDLPFSYETEEITDVTKHMFQAPFQTLEYLKDLCRLPDVPQNFWHSHFLELPLEVTQDSTNTTKWVLRNFNCRWIRSVSTNGDLEEYILVSSY